MEKKTMMKVSLAFAWVTLALFVLIGIGASLAKIPPNSNTYNPEFVKHPIQTMVHAVSGLIFMLLGPLQFIKGLRNRFPIFHRFAGRLFMIASLFIGLSGITMVITFPFAGVTEQIIIFIVAAGFLFSLYQSFQFIKKRKIALHREWIIRVFSIGLGISMIRIFIAIAQIQGMAMQDIFNLSFLFGFGSCWLVGEWWIYWTRPTTI